MSTIIETMTIDADTHYALIHEETNGQYLLVTILRCGTGEVLSDWEASTQYAGSCPPDGGIAGLISPDWRDGLGMPRAFNVTSPVSLREVVEAVTA